MKRDFRLANISVKSIFDGWRRMSEANRGIVAKFRGYAVERNRNSQISYPGSYDDRGRWTLETHFAHKDKPFTATFNIDQDGVFEFTVKETNPEPVTSVDGSTVKPKEEDPRNSNATEISVPQTRSELGGTS